MSNAKKEGMFAKLAQQQAKAISDETAPAAVTALPDDPPPSPAPAAIATPKQAPAKGQKPQVKGKRDNPDYCQANAYLPKKLRRAVDRALLDLDGLDYSTLVEDLLRKWVKSQGVSE